MLTRPNYVARLPLRYKLAVFVPLYFGLIFSLRFFLTPLLAPYQLRSTPAWHQPSVTERAEPVEHLVINSGTPQYKTYYVCNSGVKEIVLDNYDDESVLSPGACAWISNKPGARVVHQITGIFPPGPSL